MRILQIIQRNQLRGAEMFACQLSRELAKRGQEVEVLVLFGHDTGLLPFSFPVTYLHGNEKRRWMDIAGFRKMNLLIRNGKYDIVQANAGDTLKYASLSKMIFGWQGRLVFRNANTISGFIGKGPKKWLNRLLMNRVDHVASVSAVCLNDFETVFPFMRNKTSLLPIGTDVPEEDGYASLQEIGFPADAIGILHVGSFVPEKNHAGLLRIFSGILAEFPNALLLLAGTGPLQPRMQELALTLGISQSVHFLGARQDLSKIMSCCRVLVLPSLIEGLPGVILEAFARKLPVVAYDTGGIAEVVKDRQTGRLVPINDEVSFISALKDIFKGSNPDLTENAFQLVSGKYRNGVLVIEFENCYSKLHA